MAFIVFYLFTMIMTAELTAPMFENENFQNMLKEMFGMTDAEIASMSGMNGYDMVETGFFHQYYPIILLVLSIILIGKYITKAFETTTMSCYLCLPISRRKYVASTAVSLGLSVLFCGIVAYLIGLLTFNIVDMDVNFWAFSQTVLISTLSSLAVAYISMCLAFSFIGGKYRSFYIVVPIILFFVFMFKDISPILSYLSPFGWENIYLNVIGCPILIAASIYLSIKLFKRRNLSL
jgi:hypothetical protein